MNKITFLITIMLLTAAGRLHAQDLRFSQVPNQFDRNALTTGGIPRGQNTSSSRPYLNTLVLARLNVDIDDKTQRVNFIRDNADPFVITKVYKLKYANPYTLRDYILSAVQARRIAENDTYVVGIVYNNGDKFIIVSAEDYRFTDTVNGVGLDTIIKTLDQPKMQASSGSKRYMYWPMYRSAAELKTMITNVGANTKYNPEELELQYGKDKVEVDKGLNSLFFYTPLYTIKNIRYMMAQYDVPLPEVRLTYKVYELFAENDSDIGADFLAWKNNDGADLFNASLRYRSNWGGTFGSGVAKTGSSNTKFINFNPKWNSRYLDFLASRGKAKILTQGKLSVRNRQAGNITKQSGIFNVERLDEQAGIGIKEAIYGETGSFTFGTSFDNTGVDYKFYAYKSDGTRIAMNTSTDCSLAVMEINPGSAGTTSYIMSVKGNTFIDGNGINYGENITVFGFKLKKKVTVDGKEVWVTVKPSQSSSSMRNSKFALKPGRYGFHLSVNPVVNMRATIMDIDMTNVSLIGWTSDGTPRLSKDNRIKTRVHIGHNKQRFVIGGLRKREVVRSVTGVPILSKLPFLGYLFSTENESTKRSQLVLVCEAESSYPTTPAGIGVSSDVYKTEQKLLNAGDKNKYFFNQWVMDK
ncbi:hypothetical protein P0136_13005 [Lentisphaerota bacterium ZTH]|nr:hypothetical protein JYG24_09480 [Lentisphaerota bacterium]WET06277.1 hypothetical protein P0136_13005 [Lentisphaerota bacterium ZTH]